MTGPSVGVADMAMARERRQDIQTTLLTQYKTTLISFTLNVMGAVKVFPLSQRTYYEGKALITNQCTAYGLPIVHTQEVLEDTGYECFFVVNAPAQKVKQALCNLENDCALGRLFDMDVIDVTGAKVSRLSLGLAGRKCLLCGNNAFICSRSRAHSLPLLLERTCEMMWDYFADQYGSNVANLAVRALFREVLATPKPGLVDRKNTGAHTDMDVHTFERSALALMPYFVQFTLHGIDHCTQTPAQVFESLRPLGIKAELAMRRATGGVNTHKGIIFSLGILCCGLGMLYGTQTPYSQKALQDICKQLSAPLAVDFETIQSQGAISHGEQLYLRYGLRGVRGEALDGYPHLYDLAYPRFTQLLGKGLSLNDAGVLTLVDIIAHTEDSNIVSRSDYRTMEAVATQLRDLTKTPLEDQAYLSILQALDEAFIAKNISPGGSADLLAMTYFLYFLETEA